MNIELPLDIFTYPDVPLPAMWTVEQEVRTPALSLEQVAHHVRRELQILLDGASLPPGSEIAVGLGSRGIDNMALVAKTVIAALKEAGMRPFIIPAMGSHGGATPEGQTEVLHGYGLTPEALGAEIRATMEVRQVGELHGPDAARYAGQPIYCDVNAAAAAGIILLNRIKPHTDFQSDIESGIAKMSVIGLGKRHGAESVHRHGATGLCELMPRIARALPALVPLLGGIALLENELGRTAEVHAVTPAGIANDPERELTRRARAISPRLPFDDVDVLLIDEMGKNISGAGMDTHVLGRGIMPSIPESTWGGPNIRVVAVLDLTEPSHGNATALGLADLTTRRLMEKVDWQKTLVNLRTSGEGGLLRGKIPLVLPTGEDCARTAIAACGRAEVESVRVVRIRSTADVRLIEISAPLLDEARANGRLRVAAHSHPLDLCEPIPSL